MAQFKAKVKNVFSTHATAFLHNSYYMPHHPLLIISDGHMLPATFRDNHSHNSFANPSISTSNRLLNDAKFSGDKTRRDFHNRSLKITDLAKPANPHCRSFMICTIRHYNIIHHLRWAHIHCHIPRQPRTQLICEIRNFQLSIMKISSSYISRKFCITEKTIGS